MQRYFDIIRKDHVLFDLVYLKSVGQECDLYHNDLVIDNHTQ